MTGPLLSQVPMSMLCLIGGGGKAPPIMVTGLVFVLGWGLAGLLAMAAQEVGLEGGMLMLVPPFPDKALGIPTLLTTEPTVLTADAVTLLPIFNPTMPCSMLFMPGALFRVSL